MKFDGSKLRELRKARKWDQHRLAEAARQHQTGITQGAISRYENGMEPTGRNALALARALDVTVGELYGESDDEEAAPVSRADLAVTLAEEARRIAAVAEQLARGQVA